MRFTLGVMKICPAPPPKILAFGLERRARSTQGAFWRLNHFDWIAAAVVTVLAIFVYSKAEA